MPCDSVLIDGQVVGIVCTRGRRRKAQPCEFCGAPHSLLCDGPGSKPGTTCDARMCTSCSLRVGRKPGGETVDLCPVCQDAYEDARGGP